MKLIKQLIVGGEQLHIIDDHVMLFHNSPGRATFKVESTKQPNGRVILNMRYAQKDKFTQYFVGFVELATQLNTNVWLINCREISILLSLQLPLSLQHATIANVAEKLSAATGLKFNIADNPYAQYKAPYFCTTGSGLYAMDLIGQVFNIDNYIWCQQGDGRIYIGSWNDSIWSKRVIEMPDKYRQKISNDQIRMPVVTNLRPHTIINKQRVAIVELSGQFMTVTWIR